MLLDDVVHFLEVLTSCPFHFLKLQLLFFEHIVHLLINFSPFKHFLHLHDDLPLFWDSLLHLTQLLNFVLLLK